MQVRKIMEEMELFLIAGASGVDNEINSIYICDKCSWVMSNAEQKSLWITMQNQPEIVDVAIVIGAACVIVSEGVYVGRDTVDKANSAGIPLFASSYTAFELSKQLAKLGY